MAIPFLFVILGGTIIATIFSVNALVNTLRFGLPYVSTPKWAVEWLVQNLQLKPNDVVCELGCGDARVLVALAKKHPEIQFIGIEIQWWPWLLAKIRAHNTKNVGIRLGNFLTADLSAVTIFYGFFITVMMPRVAEKLAERLQHGAELISFGFALPGHTSYKEIPPPGGKGSKIRFYKS